jgi:hypothetical protein
MVIKVEVAIIIIIIIIILNCLEYIDTAETLQHKIAILGKTHCEGDTDFVLNLMCNIFYMRPGGDEL